MSAASGARRPLAAGFAMLAAAAMMGITAGCARSTPPESATPPVQVTNVTLTADQRQRIHLVTVQPSAYHKTVDTTGTVNFDNDQATVVLTPISGPVSKILVALGDHVKAGQPLAEVDSPDFAAAISAYRKALATSKITRQLAEQDQDLLQHHGVSLREAEQAKIDATNAAADTEAAFQQLVSLQVEPATLQAIKQGKDTGPMHGVIRSPITGTVVDRPITPGELLQAGTTVCFTVADLSKVWVMADIYESDLADIALGDPADVLGGATTNFYPGTVDNISAVVDPNTRSIAVRVVAANPDDALKMQMYVHVLIHSRKQRTGILVPAAAILRNEENLPFVYLAQADGSYARADVTLGARVADQYEIPTGLKGGDQVVTDGALFLQFVQNQ